MELVIDIPEKEYKRWQDEGEMDALIVRNSLVNGTPLPKGHGDLIDRSDLIPDSDYEDGDFYAVSVGAINSAPTIIGEDKAESEG